MTTLTQLDADMKKRHTVKRASTMAITHDDSKVLGRITDMRTEKVRESQKFSTFKMKTQNSAWTPVVNKVSNEQVLLLSWWWFYLSFLSVSAFPLDRNFTITI